MNNKNIYTIFLMLRLIFVECFESYNILGIFPIAGGSHFILDSKLMKGLAEAGHNITVIIPYKLKIMPKNGTYTEVIIEELAETFEKFLDRAQYLNPNKAKQTIIYKLKGVMDLFTDMVNITLHHPKVKKLLKSDVQFDAVLTENIFSDALKIFAYVYNCPLINLISMGPKAWINSAVENSNPISYIPHLFLPSDYMEGMPFFNRIKNLFYHVVDYLCHQYYYMPIHNELIHSAFPNVPDIWEISHNISLVLLNSHTSLYQPVPTIPNMVEIGGYHIDPPRRLPKDLERFINQADKGVIYFSLGSNIRSKDMSDHHIEILLKVFGKLEQRVLWKFDNESVVVPINVLIGKWFPQQDILAHPNVRLFITHAGILSLMETVYHGVPILALPIANDQLMNTQKAVQCGIGLKLDYFEDFNDKTFKALIKELLANRKYKENAQKVSKIFHDRPIKPMKNAVYWVEYVIRNNGAEHLKVIGAKNPWYTYYLFDILAFLLLVILLLVLSLRTLVKLL